MAALGERRAGLNTRKRRAKSWKSGRLGNDKQKRGKC
jgi:hypothetical protein